MTTFAVSDIAKVPQKNDTYAEGIVVQVEPRLGYKGSYPYSAVKVEMEDGSFQTHPDYTLIRVPNKGEEA